MISAGTGVLLFSERCPVDERWRPRARPRCPASWLSCLRRNSPAFDRGPLPLTSVSLSASCDLKFEILTCSLAAATLSAFEAFGRIRPPRLERALRVGFRTFDDPFGPSKQSENVPIWVLMKLRKPCLSPYTARNSSTVAVHPPANGLSLKASTPPSTPACSRRGPILSLSLLSILKDQSALTHVAATSTHNVKHGNTCHILAVVRPDVTVATATPDMRVPNTEQSICGRDKWSQKLRIVDAAQLPRLS